MKAMEQKETPLVLAPPLPVIPRLDRLDRLLQLLEEKESMSEKHLCNPVMKKTEEEEEDQRKSLSSALEEVHHKGTLMDRLTMLENRVLQLSIVMDEGNTSRSSSSTIHVSKNLCHDLAVSKGSRHDEGEVATQHAKKDEPPLIQEKPSEEECTTKKRNGKREKRKGYRKWIGWFRCGQERHWNDNFDSNIESN